MDTEKRNSDEAIDWFELSEELGDYLFDIRNAKEFHWWHLHIWNLTAWVILIEGARMFFGLFDML